MLSFTGIYCPFDIAFIPRGLFSRPQLCPPQKLVVCRAKIDSAIYGLVSSRLVTPSLLAAEKEEAKAVLTLFLKNLGLSNVVVARTIKKSDLFIDDLVSRLYSVHKSRYRIGRELTTLEIRDALLPYLESLLEEHGNFLVDVIENFPNVPDTERPVVPVVSVTEAARCGRRDVKKVKAMSRVSVPGSSGSLPPHIVYFIELGLDHEQIKVITGRFPAFAYYSLEGKIMPMIEFLLDLGVSKSAIPNILVKRPQLFGMSLSENLIPTMAFFETLGVDKSKWAKLVTRFPAILTYSRIKVQATVEFLSEVGIPKENIGKIITRCPNIISYSVEDKLRPTAEYFRSLGVDVGVMLRHCPQTIGLSIEANLKPVTEFFLENGFSMEEIGTMISRYGALYTFSLKDNLVPKWELFSTMDYPREVLLKFPQYFGYSLKDRIKPRYKVVEESGIKLPLARLLTISDDDFESLLKRKMKKLQFDECRN